MKFSINFRPMNMAKIITAIAILTFTFTSCQQSKTDDKDGKSEATQEIQFPNIYEITVSEKTDNGDFVSTSPVITAYNPTAKTTADFNNFLKKSQQYKVLPTDLPERSLCFKQLADLILKYPNEAFADLGDSYLYQVNLSSPDQKVKIHQIIECWDSQCDPSLPNAFTQLLYTPQQASSNDGEKLLSYSTDILHILFNDFYMERYATGIYCEKDKDGNTFYLISYIDYFSKGHDLISDKIVAFTIEDNGIQAYNAFRINGKESSTFAFDYNITNDSNLTPITYDATHKMLIVPEIESKTMLPTGTKLQYKFNGTYFKYESADESKF